MFYTFWTIQYVRIRITNYDYGMKRKIKNGIFNAFKTLQAMFN